MRKTFVTLALAASTLAAAACSAQTQPQTAAQANRAVEAQIQNDDASPPPPMGDYGARRGGMRGMHGGGMMRADTNGDGVITRAEAMAQADMRFARMDASGDGKVTAEDMQMRREARGKATAGKSGMNGPGMRRGDPNGDGVMTKAEAEQRAMQRFDRMDANHDGKLDRTELANFREMRRERRDDRQGGDMPPPPPADDNQ